MARKAIRLEWFTIAWNCLEAVIALASGLLAGSIALVGFGFDSCIEVASGSAVLWRMRHDAEEARREGLERASLRMVGACFLALALYMAYESAECLLAGKAPNPSLAGILLAAAVDYHPATRGGASRISESFPARRLSNWYPQDFRS